MIDNSLDKNYVSKYVTDFCLNYAETNDAKKFYIDIYYVKDFYKNKEKVGIIKGQKQYSQFLPTKKDGSYKEYIKEKVAKLINNKSK